MSLKSNSSNDTFALDDLFDLTEVINSTWDENRTDNRTPFYCEIQTQSYLNGVLMLAVPVLVVAGVVGNVLNLIVLNSKGMRTKTNFVLSAMAGADLAHAALAMPVNLHLYEDLIDSDRFSYYYHHEMKSVLVTLVNWLSMTSTWLAVLVTVERLIAIQSPLKARSILRKRYIVVAVILVAVFSFIVSSYYLFCLRRRVVADCNRPTRMLYRLHFDSDLWFFGHFCRKLHTILSALLPVILLFIFNGSLVYHLHKNHAIMEMFSYDTGGGNTCDSRSGSTVMDNRREYQVAVVVIIISLSSACLLLPSAALVIYDTVRVSGVFRRTPWWYRAASDVSNLLILFEKVLDFFLYCLTSGYFRRRLVAVLYSYCALLKRGRRGSNALKQAQNGNCGCRENDKHKPLLTRAMRLRLHGKPPLLKRQSTQSTLTTFASLAAGRFRRLTTTSTTSASSGQSAHGIFKKLDDRQTPPRPRKSVDDL